MWFYWFFYLKEMIKIFILSSVIISISLNCYLRAVNSPQIGMVVGAVLFSTALLLIKEYKLKLFTSTVKELKDLNSLKYNLKVLLLNLVGSQTFLVFGNDVSQLQGIKLAETYPNLFIDSFFCGMIITLATNTKDKLITVFCIMTFIVCGFEHCIVNFCLYAGVIDLQVFLFLLVNLIGNSLGGIICFRTLNRVVEMNSEKVRS